MGFLEGFGKKLGVLSYKGTWNAQTNSPLLSDSSGAKGEYYIVSASGTSSLGGISLWETGDWVIHNGSVWQKMDAADKEKINDLENQINDETTSRQSAIDTEQSARVAADATLQAAIDAEITARQSADAEKVSASDAVADGYKVTQSVFVSKTQNHTLLSSDNGKILLFDSSSAVTVTVPSGLSIGFSCTIIQIGSGQVSFVASGVTLNSVSGLKIVGQHGAASVVSYSTNIFNVSGATTAW